MFKYILLFKDIMEYKVHYKEKLYFNIMIIISIISYAVLIKTQLIAGFIFISGILSILGFLGSCILISNLKGNAVKINVNQFPEAFAILESHSKKLGFKKTPDMYVLQSGGVLNAFATKFARKNYVVLYSDILEVAYKDSIEAVSFVIGHELGHLKRKHTSFIKRLLTLPCSFIPFLTSAYHRACEYTCDNIGYYLCPNGALKGTLILAAGKHLYKNVNISELITNTKNESKLSISFAEVFSSHPALVKRIAAINKLSENIV